VGAAVGMVMRPRPLLPIMPRRFKHSDYPGSRAVTPPAVGPAASPQPASNNQRHPRAIVRERVSRMHKFARMELKWPKRRTGSSSVHRSRDPRIFTGRQGQVRAQVRVLDALPQLGRPAAGAMSLVRGPSGPERARSCLKKKTPRLRAIAVRGARCRRCQAGYSRGPSRRSRSATTGFDPRGLGRIGKLAKDLRILGSLDEDEGVARRRSAEYKLL